MYSPHVKKKQAGPANRLFPSLSVSSPFLSVRNYIIGLGCTLVFGLLVLLFCTYIAYRSADPSRLLMPMSMAAWNLSAFFAGVITIRLTKGSALLSGLISGMLLLGTCLLICWCLPTNDSSTISRGVWFRIAAPFFSICGAYIAQKRRKTHYKSKRKPSYKKRNQE